MDISDLTDLVSRALAHLSAEGHTSVDLSVVVDCAKNAGSVMDDIDSALDLFKIEVPKTSVKEIKIVVYDATTALQS